MIQPVIAEDHKAISVFVNLRLVYLEFHETPATGGGAATWATFLHVRTNPSHDILRLSLDGLEAPR
jgi:hypothetical protein